MAKKPIPRKPSAPEQWRDHEHVVPPVQIQAQKLLDEAGSPDLAKHAVDEAAKTAPGPGSPHDQFARQLGFASYLALFEASTPLASSGGKQWCVTALRQDQWMLWNDDDLVASGPYPTREAAEREVRMPARDESGGGEAV